MPAYALKSYKLGIEHRSFMHFITALLRYKLEKHQKTYDDNSKLTLANNQIDTTALSNKHDAWRTKDFLTRGQNKIKLNGPKLEV